MQMIKFVHTNTTECPSAGNHSIDSFFSLHSHQIVHAFSYNMIYFSISSMVSFQNAASNSLLDLNLDSGLLIG